jgi:glycosyltransferase involved in cell wall biosynthesis
VWIRSYHVLRLLSRAFDVTALCFERTGSARKSHDASASLAELRRFGAVESYPVPQGANRARYLWDHLRSALRGRVYTRYVYASATFHDRVAELLHTRGFDLVHMDSLDLSTYLPLCEGTPTVCVHHSVESDLLRRRARFEGGALASAYYRFQGALMEKEERFWLPRVALNVTVSEEDRDVLAQRQHGARFAVVPNGVDTDEFRPTELDGSGLAYIGGTSWFPNRDALDFFCEEILPHLREAGSAPRTRWVGGSSEAEQRRYRERYGVELTGYVDDVRPHMREALCHVVPLRAGGGTRLKILNSWAMAKPVVSTSLGCEGLAAVDGENILIRDEPKAFADAIVTLERDEVLRRRIAAGGRSTVERIYDWEVIGKRMIDTYLDLLGSRACSVPPIRGPVAP